MASSSRPCHPPSTDSPPPISYTPPQHAAQVASQAPSSSSSPPPSNPATCSLQRLRQWSANIDSLPSSLASSPPLSRSPTSLLPPSPFSFSLHVGLTALADELQRPAFLTHLRNHLDPLLADMPPMSRFGSGKKAVWTITLSPSGRHYAHLSRQLSQSGSYALPFADSIALIPSSPAPPTLPPASTRLKFLNIPPSLAKEGLPHAILTAAGYVVRQPSITVDIPPPGEVLLLQYRVGRDANASVLIVDVLPPASDPHLHRLPPFMPAHSVDGFVFATLVDKDPLPRLPDSSSRRPSVAVPPSTASPSSPHSPPPQAPSSSSASAPPPSPSPPAASLAEAAVPPPPARRPGLSTIPAERWTGGI